MWFHGIKFFGLCVFVAGCVTTTNPGTHSSKGADGVYRAGEKVPQQQALTANEAVSKPRSGDSIVMAGMVDKVCQAKGCWMTIKTDRSDVRVTFKDYGFFVPLNSAGKKVKMVGELKLKEISVADQKHYLEDAGASKATIDQIVTPKKEYSFVASGVEVYP